MTPSSTRRDFLKQTSTFAAVAAAASAARAGTEDKPDSKPSSNAPASPNEKVHLGIIGPAGRGVALLRAFLPMPDVDIVHLCDIDEGRLGEALSMVEEGSGKQPKTTRDLRELLADKTVDAVAIATPDHWHAPATILACDAGKHVYCEKPASHNLREGRLMIEAARRNKRVVQIGMQSRSNDYIQRGMQLLRDGAIGDVLVSKAFNSQLRANIGHKQPTKPPKGVDYDLWVGPAEMVPFQTNRFHSNWRWWHNFGTGDIGNDGVHDVDIARWGLGVERHPDRVAGQGGKYFFDDDQEFPDTYTVSFEYDLGGGKKRQLIYEQRTWSPYMQEGYWNGNAFYGTKGMMLLGKAFGWKIIGENNKPVQEVKGKLKVDPHCRNFIDCVKSGQTPAADIEVAHLSSSLAHLGNIALRTGRCFKFDAKAEHILGDDDANALIRRKYREGHWAIPKGI
jgi:predicted dehydrogenase